VCISDFSIGTRVAVLCFFGGLPPVFGLHVLFSSDGHVFIGGYCASSVFLPLTINHCTEYRFQSHPPSPHSIAKRTPVLTTTYSTSIFLRPLLPFSSSRVQSRVTLYSAFPTLSQALFFISPSGSSVVHRHSFPHFPPLLDLSVVSLLSG
jgi:hypothetical protein